VFFRRLAKTQASYFFFTKKEKWAKRKVFRFAVFFRRLAKTQASYFFFAKKKK